MTKEHDMRGPFRRIASFLAFAAVLYAGVVGWFAWKEDLYVYFPRKGLHDAARLNIRIETVALMTPDSVRLVCWIIPARDSSDVWVLYFQGNGGNISSRGYVEHYKALTRQGLNIFALGYRGYGGSEGSPSEEGFYRDARAAYDYLVHERGISPARIILFGYSLGSAVAVELAANVATAAVILEGAFMSAHRLGRDYYPFLPMALVMKNRYDSMSKIQHVAEPKLFLHAVDDEIVPIEHGRKLFEAASEPKAFVELLGGHNTAHTADSARFYGSITAFLQQLDLVK